ncbi:MAG: TlpA family protein disulfide reductase [Prevotella sp.]|nr:TlpA family protein disulfide reductase [Prevotella sp.]
MNKKIIITALLVLVAIAGQAQESIVWEKPSAFMGAYNSEFEITKVELKQMETVLHVLANYNPGSWIRFDKNSFVQTPDGKKYAFTSGAKTNEKESDLQPDSLFWMPESGMAHLALHFEPVPLDTKEMDFSEGDVEGAFQFWNISDSNAQKETVLPADWQNVEYAKDETLPIAKINKGVATIKVRMLGYKPGMKLDFYVGGFIPLGSTERFDKKFPFADDGTLTAEIPMWLAREVTVGVEGMSLPKIVIAPGQETSILMKITSDQRPFVAFKGYLAKTNMDMVNAYDTLEPYSDGVKTYQKVKECQTPEERLQCLKDIFNQRVADASRYTTAAKDLLCMEAERNFFDWVNNFAHSYSHYWESKNGVVYWGNDHYLEDVEKNKDLLVFSLIESGYAFQYLDEPTSPCSSAFWQLDPSDFEFLKMNAYNCDLRRIYYKIDNDDNDNNVLKIYDITNEDCKAVVREYEAEQQRIAQQLVSQENVFFQKYDNIAPENILQTILGKYKGKTVLIDIWATWCGPCRAGHRRMKPLKEELIDKDIVFVYITSPSSPLNTWQEMIKDIDGDHYYLTYAQYKYILDKYESDGIPTYAIYDAQGQQTFKNVGFPGVDKIKGEIEKTLK